MDVKRTRRWKLAALILGTIWLSIGCNPATMLGFLLNPWFNDTFPPECPLASKKKETTIVITAAFAGLETREEYSNLHYEISEYLAREMRQQFHENREKVKIIPPGQVKSYQIKYSEDDLLTARHIGEHFKADYVVSLEIQSFSLYDKKSPQILRGNTQIQVQVLDMHGPRDELKMDQLYERSYPRVHVLEATSKGQRELRQKFLTVIARDLTRKFTPYPTEAKWEMD